MKSSGSFRTRGDELGIDRVDQVRVARRSNCASASANSCHPPVPLVQGGRACRAPAGQPGRLKAGGHRGKVLPSSAGRGRGAQQACLVMLMVLWFPE